MSNTDSIIGDFSGLAHKDINLPDTVKRAEIDKKIPSWDLTEYARALYGVLQQNKKMNRTKENQAKRAHIRNMKLKKTYIPGNPYGPEAQNVQESRKITKSPTKNYQSSNLKSPTKKYQSNNLTTKDNFDIAALQSFYSPWSKNQKESNNSSNANELAHSKWPKDFSTRNMQMISGYANEIDKQLLLKKMDGNLPSHQIEAQDKRSSQHSYYRLQKGVESQKVLASILDDLDTLHKKFKNSDEIIKNNNGPNNDVKRIINFNENFINNFNILYRTHRLEMKKNKEKQKEKQLSSNPVFIVGGGHVVKSNKFDNKNQVTEKFAASTNSLVIFYL